MVIDKKIKRTMLESKSLYFGTLALIVFSCLLYTLLNQLVGNLKGITSSFESRYVQEDASFVADKKLNDIPALEAKFDMSIEEGGSFDYAISDGKTLRVFAETSKVNRYAVIEGSRLAGGDMLIDPAYAKANRVRIGDSIKIYGKTFKVSGYMSLPNYIYPLKSEGDLLSDPNSFGIAVISRSDYDRFGQGTTFYSLKLHSGADHAEDRLAAFKEELKSRNVTILQWMNIEDNLRAAYVIVKMNSIQSIGSSLPVVILLLTCILTGIVMWRMLRSEFVVVGTLYAMGYRKGEIMKHYLKYPLAIAVAGGVLGTALGAVALGPMLAFMLSYFNMPADAVIFNVKDVAVSLLLPILFLGICGWLVIRRALKSKPVELMRGGGERRKIGFLEKRVKLDGLKFAVKFKIREQLRSIPRSLFLLLGVVLATMLLLLGFTLKSSIDQVLQESFEGAFKYQYQYMFNSPQSGNPAQGEAFSEIPFALEKDRKTSITVYGVQQNSRFIALKDLHGDPVGLDKVVVTKPLAEKLGLKAGDTIGVAGKLDGKKYTVMVDRIADTSIGSYIYMPLPKLNAMLGLPADSYFGLWSEDRLDIPASKLLTATTTEDIRKAFQSMLQPLQASMGTIAFMSFLIGLIVIYVVTSLVIEENKDNISLMKVLGYRKKEVYSLILNSSAYIIVLGYILGVPLLLVSLGALYKSATASMNLALPVKIDYIYILIGFAVMYLTYEISKALSKKKIKRISMTEALKSRAE